MSPSWCGEQWEQWVETVQFHASSFSRDICTMMNRKEIDKKKLSTFCCGRSDLERLFIKIKIKGHIFDNWSISGHG